MYQESTVKNLVFALLAAIFSSSSFAEAMDTSGRSLPAANVIAPAFVAKPLFPMAKIATGAFVLDGDSIHPSSPMLSLYITPSAQWYASAILQAAAQWGSACGVQFEHVKGEPPATAPSGRTVVVVEFGTDVLKGATATTYRMGSPDGKNLIYARVVLTDSVDDSDLYFVLLHEMGHAIGLPHTKDPAAVMHWSDGDRLYHIATGTRASITSTDLDGCKQLMASAKRLQANSAILANQPF